MNEHLSPDAAALHSAERTKPPAERPKPRPAAPRSNRGLVRAKRRSRLFAAAEATSTHGEPDESRLIPLLTSAYLTAGLPLEFAVRSAIADYELFKDEVFLAP
jgi:hypothetical protein